MNNNIILFFDLFFFCLLIIIYPVPSDLYVVVNSYEGILCGTYSNLIIYCKYTQHMTL